MLRRIQNLGKSAGGLILLLLLLAYVWRLVPDQDPTQPTGQDLPADYRQQDFTVQHVIDGDSLILRDQTGTTYEVRLQGVDAPEYRQQYGPQAEKALQRRLRGETVKLRVDGKDRYGRHIGYLTHEGDSINYWLIASGHAWHYARYNDDPRWAEAQQSAKRERRGLWGKGDPVAPWVWRDRN
jgi:endonuclease YncB( thermonuclease family)